MLSHKGIDTNICFLILEVRKQLQKTRLYLEAPSDDLLESIKKRDDYIDNLRSIIQRKCFSQAASIAESDETSVDLLKAFDVVSQNLERIADFCEDIVNQARHIKTQNALPVSSFDPFFDEIISGVNRIDTALFERNVQVALRICRAEHNLDVLYTKHFEQTIEELKTTRDPHSHVTLVFIYHYFERMGDALLNVGEATLSAFLGERIKISRFWALEDTLDNVEVREADAIALEPMADTRSGSRISRIEDKSPERSRTVIFKEGQLGKLQEEKENIERWHEVMPGLAPQIHSFHAHEDTGATLFEYLPGQTFEEILLTGSVEDVQFTLSEITKVVEQVWNKTKVDTPSRADFARQLRKRLPDVFEVHPKFEHPAHEIGGVTVDSFEHLLERTLPLDEKLPCPFSVLIHGDMNVDNLIYDREKQQVRFIDLHRSRMMDYVQDVSVFLVSNYRLQALENPLRSRLDAAMHQFYEFASDYARRSGDATFDARLCLGIARSLATSTRFILARKMAKSMFLRSRYLIERLLAWESEDYSDFRIPIEVLND